MKRHITLTNTGSGITATYSDGTPVQDRAVLEQISFLAYEPGQIYTVTIADKSTGKVFRPNEVIVNIQTTRSTF